MWRRVVGVRRVLLPVALLGAALLAAAAAQAFWQYRGHISDSKHSTFQLVVHHSDTGKPRSVQLAFSGRLSMVCANGSHARAHVRTGFFPAPLNHRGHFVDGGFGLRLTFHHGQVSATVTVSRISGRVERDSAHGKLRLKARASNRRKGCDTGRLHWRAHFVPRS
jgi:hypothetical protein